MSRDTSRPNPMYEMYRISTPEQAQEVMANLEKVKPEWEGPKWGKCRDCGAPRVMITERVTGAYYNEYGLVSEEREIGIVCVNDPSHPGGDLRVEAVGVMIQNGKLVDRDGMPI